MFSYLVYFRVVLFIPALVKHTRVWSNWVNGVTMMKKVSNDSKLIKAINILTVGSCYLLFSCTNRFNTEVNQNVISLMTLTLASMGNRVFEKLHPL